MNRLEFLFRKMLSQNIGQVAPDKLQVSDIQALTADQLDSLDAGDVVIKVDETGKHAYLVSYVGAGGLSLTYTDCDNVETIAYTKSESGWVFDDKTVTNIGSLRQ